MSCSMPKIYPGQTNARLRGAVEIRTFVIIYEQASGTQVVIAQIDASLRRELIFRNLLNLYTTR